MPRKTTAILQARMGSQRLPGKSLAEIGGKPLLGFLLERLRHCRNLEEVVVATTVLQEDDAIAEVSRRFGAPVFRGHPEDVLDRYYQAARDRGADPVVRITADNPLLDPFVLDAVVNAYREGLGDFVSNNLEPSYPDGMDAEVFGFGLLETAWREAALPSEREHLTPFFWHHPERFRLHNVRYPKDVTFIRCTVDYEEDLRVVRAVVRELSSKGLFRLEDILDLQARRPDLFAANRHHLPFEGYRQTRALESGELPPWIKREKPCP